MGTAFITKPADDSTCGFERATSSWNEHDDHDEHDAEECLNVVTVGPS